MSYIPWEKYSKKLRGRIENPKNAGFFSEKDARKHQMRLVIGNSGELKKGNQLSFYLLVDESDGVIADARFQVFGETALLGAADAICEWILRKNYLQARNLSVDLIDRTLRDKENIPAFPKETYGHLNLVLDALDDAADKCMDIPIAEEMIISPLPQEEGEGPQEYPGWLQLSKEQKLAVIKQCIEKEVQPYVELDEGGVEVLDLKDNEVSIGYRGTCTSCYSATGSTLEAIQQILCNKVYPNLTVVPDLSFLKTSVD